MVLAKKVQSQILPPELVWPILVQRAIKEGEALAAYGAHKTAAISGAARPDAVVLVGLSKKFILGDFCGVSAGSSLFGAMAQLLAGQARMSAYFFVKGSNVVILKGTIKLALLV